MDLSKSVIVWKFSDAPEEYQKLSGNGGDEDWLAWIPEKFFKASKWYSSEQLPHWLEKLDVGQEPEIIRKGNGWIIIGSH